MKIRLPAASWAAVIPVAILIGTIAGVGGAGASAQSAPIAQSGPAAATRSTAPFVPQPILPGGQIVTLFPPDSPYLHKDRIGEPEQNNLQKTVPGRIQSIVNIHNPSIEVHVVDPGNNTGAAIILAPGGGHNTLNVGTEGADFVSYFYNFGVTTIILRNRLRRDGYDPLTDEVNDAQQAIRLVRSRAKEWNIDPAKIGMMGFSAGAELVAPAASPAASRAPAHPPRVTRTPRRPTPPTPRPSRDDASPRKPFSFTLPAGISMDLAKQQPPPKLRPAAAAGK